MKVDFLIIGAQKSGTSSLAHQLSQHPRICFCRRKEPHFFSDPDWRNRLDEYHALFSPKDGQVSGEASTSYTFYPRFPNTRKHIHDYNPSMKLVYIVRNPVSRIESHYNYRHIKGKVSGAPEKEVSEDSSYIDRSKYWTQLQPYIETFGPERILVLVFEEYISDPFSHLSTAFEFLEVGPVPRESIDLAPRHVTARGGRTLRRLQRSSLARRTPRPVRKAVSWPLEMLLRATGIGAHKTIPLPEAVRDQVWHHVHDDVRSLGAFLRKDLVRLWGGPQ